MIPQKLIDTFKLAFAGLLLVGIILLLLFTCNQPKVVEPSKKVEQVKNTPPVKYVDKGGTVHTEKPVAVANIATIKASYERIIDSLTRVLKIKDKRITDLLAVGTTTTGTFKPKIDTVVIHGTNTAVVSYQDKWLSVSGVVNEDSQWSYSYKDSLSFTTYNKKTGFLKLGRTLMLDAFSHNPNTTIEGLTAIKISKAKPKKFGIGVNVGYGFDGKVWKPVVGVGVNYNLIRF